VNNILTITLKHSVESLSCRLSGKLPAQNKKSMLNYSRDWNAVPIAYCVQMGMIGWLGLTMMIFGNPGGAGMMENPAAMLE
tara:strand:+ start:331 stop:573 length:243 start_codon:yes stop_codon:yes gene_type:complete